MVEPQPGGDYAAHTLILFEFGGDRIVGLTVEARLEQGETYDAIAGVFNTLRTVPTSGPPRANC